MNPSRPIHVRQLAAELEMLAHGKTQAFDPSGGAPSADKHPAPIPDPDVWHLRFLTEYDRAPGPPSRDQVVEHWRKELRMLRGHGIKRTAGESIEDTDRRMVREGIGWTVDEVARHFRCTPTRVRRACMSNGVRIEGERLATDRTVPTADSLSEARRLREGGMSVRAIGLALGVDAKQVQRWLGKAA